jgi:hypothetical protein
MKVKIRPISVTAIRDYHNSAYNQVNITDEILKLKINCLIDASEHKQFVTCGTAYRFGSCIIETDRQDRIRSIKWTKERKLPDRRELTNLSKAYLSCGLDKDGKRFLTEEERIEKEKQMLFKEMFI